MPRNPETTWDMLNVAFCNFRAYIERKPDRFDLSLVDLLHVSNFKGGNASITEAEGSVNSRLRDYSQVLREISYNFDKRLLGSLSDGELITLKTLCDRFVRLTLVPNEQIRGLGPSYASALLSAHFPELIPVLDRRVINGAGIQAEINGQGQIKNIQNYYGQVIEAFHRVLCDHQSLCLRELDRQWFILPLAS